ncbi:SEFIR domain-containing protein [Mycobacterium sp. 050128]|uniref:SEFIR domain-containing protein n=1 Tax=Mycobacterium sp. 050128 TaxID=3096112 RepID=UPI002ED8F2D6
MTSSAQATESGETPTAPTALVSWAHTNIDWKHDQAAQWEQAVKQFAQLLRTFGVDADLDLWHLTETSIDWTRWGQDKALTSQFVIIVLSEAWKQRWQGANAPTVGAGAVAEADTLKGIFGKNQTEFQHKTLLVLLPGVPTDVVPEDLYRLNRFSVAELTRAGIDDLLRALFNAPKHTAPPVGEAPTFDRPPTPAHPATPFETHDRGEYLALALAVSDERCVHRRRGAGLTDVQVQRSLTHRAHVPDQLQRLGPGQLRILYGPLGSGKSDIAEEWYRSNIAAARKDAAAAIPLWISIDDLAAALEPHVLTEVGLPALSRHGVDAVIDGLDERINKAAALTRQAGEFVKKWPASRILLTTRAPELVNDDILIRAPLLSNQEAGRLMTAVASATIPHLGPQLQTAVARPLFALLTAQHLTATDGATGLPEIVDRVVADVVSREKYDLFAELRALAVETIRTGGAIDPTSIASADIAAMIRASPFVVTEGRKCAFALATFEQWFAAQAIIDNIVGMDEVLVSMDTFNRWRYVLAIIAATANPTRADTVMAALAGWNPGAASWVVDETRAGSLTRAFPDIGQGDWEEVGGRIRTATQAWLHGLGPLADCFWPTRTFGASFDDVAVAVGIGNHGMTVSWLPRFQIPDQPLTTVVEDVSVFGPGKPQRSYIENGFKPPTAINGIWELTRDLLASDLTHSFTARALEIARQHHGIASEEERVYNAAMKAMYAAPPGFTGNLDIERLYPAADIQPSPAHRSGGYTTETMYRYAVAVIDAAMRCYLELSTWVTPHFDRTLGVRGLMPAEFFGTMFYSPDRERSIYDLFGPHEPRFSWLFRPLGPTSSDIDPAHNRISLTINDTGRSDEMTKDKTRLYTAFRRYIEANPAHEPFARSFTSTHGRMHVFHRTPATRLAIRWLWEDLDALGFLKGTAPHDI